MRYQHDAVLSSVCNAQYFLEEHRAALGAVNPTARRELDDIVEELTTLSVTQVSGRQGSKGETSRKHALHAARRHHHMAPIAHMVRYRLTSSPEFVALTVPRHRVSAESLVISANSMADAATPHAQMLIDGGLSPAFLDELRAAAQALSDSIVERGNSK